ncbi:histidine kinase [Runella sp. SP2]|uniref:histidine kinase n=1 Tax=Runella sp. SP2 TaxID=2268026 RepID=UPI000F08E9F3|nr:histidine kinase [Runella sp. SP2]AYQ36116.1 hypothetical protein DTQ70_29945 [Runella sp. SP2]
MSTVITPDQQLGTPSKVVTYPAEGLKYLQLETLSGNIELIGHDENAIRVEVFASVRSLLSLFLYQEPVTEFPPDINPLVMTIVGESLKITARPNYFNPYNWVHFHRTSFRIFLPPSLHSFIKTYGGHVRLQHLSGNHKFDTWGGHLLLLHSQGNYLGKTMGGNIEVAHCQGNIELSTFGGKVTVSDNEGSIRADTKGGNVVIHNHKGKINGSTWGGNIEATNITGDLECSTSGGNVRLRHLNGNIGASTRGGNINAEVTSIHQYSWFDTSGGNIKVALPLHQGLDLEVVAGRVIHPRFQDFNGYSSRSNLRGKLNGGGPNVTIRSFGGRVTLSPYQSGSPAPAPYSYVPTDYPRHPFTEPNTPAPPSPTPSTPPPAVSNNHERTPSPFSLEGMLIAFLFCLFLGYGLSGVVYFSLEFFRSHNILSTGIFFSNIANSLGAWLALQIFIHFLDSKVHFPWAKYLTVIGLTFLFVLSFQTVIGIFYWSKIPVASWPSNVKSTTIFYLILPQIVSCAYLYYWQRTRQITRKISEQEYQLLNLEKLKTKAQLNALEARINPHFLYNSLNSIAGLVHQDPDKAEEMTIQLSKLFRSTTGRSEAYSHSIAEELEVVKSYLAIEQMRFGNRLQFKVEVQPSLLDVKIPRFLLQPLVENAIKHGISQLLDHGIIEICIERTSNHVLFTIHDNGPAFKEEVASGYGLRSIREKLQLVYGDKATLQIQNNDHKAVIISLPRDHEWTDWK